MNVRNYSMAEKLINYGRRKLKTDKNYEAYNYMYNSGFLDKNGLITRSGQNLIQFMDFDEQYEQV